MLKPDVCGMRLEEAEILMREAGISCSVEKIEPFFKAAPQPQEKGSFRVIRIREDASGGLLLTVCAVPDS